jgi:FtsZ-interacting cell division protein ZipA
MSTKLIVGVIAIVAIGIIAFYIRSRRGKSTIKSQENSDKDKPDTAKK